MIPFPEYPRPQLERKNDYLILNGEWKGKVLDKNENIIKEGKIIVPYSPEATLSEFNHILQPSEKFVYSKEISLPFSFDRERERLFLHFGAVDYLATIYIDDIKVTAHKGGYLPFSIEVYKSKFTLKVEVEDPSDSEEQERGKQSLTPGGIWYTSQSGIWKTVWIEKTPVNYIESVRITPHLKSVDILVKTNKSDDVTLKYEGGEYIFKTNENFTLFVDNPHLWSPEDPYLYYFTLKYKDDEVFSYFALRTFTIEEDNKGIKRFFLNEKPYFLHGVLDQGYYSGGLYTPHCEEEVINDIALMKRLGFNTLRKHIKIEDARWYYHCDKEGMLVIQDIPSGGGKYKAWVISIPLILGSFLKDNHYTLYSRKDKNMRLEFENNTKETIALLYNTPSICMWVPFNEGWGQFDSSRLSNEILSLDNTRFIDPNSGWHDQKYGNVVSKHVYFKKYKFKKDKLGRVVFLSECGGFGYSNDKKSFSYKNCRSKEELTETIVSFYKEEVIPNIKKGLSGCIYTQLSDVENEKNGFITYNRSEVKVKEEKIREVSKEIVSIL